MTKISQNDLRALIRETVAKKLSALKEGALGPVQNPGSAQARVDGVVADMKREAAAGHLTDIAGIAEAVRSGAFGPSEYGYLFSQLEKAGLGEWAQKAQRFLKVNTLQTQAPGMGESVKITKDQLTKLVNETVKAKLTSILTEADDPKSEPGTMVPSAKAVVAFSKKCDDLITKMIEEIRKLADDGEELIDPNLLNAPETGSRNELVIHRVGMLRTTANGLATFFERVRRSSP